ncbi:MAG: hypothetical protein R3C09_07780 [Pirellulaceae bacterium]|jgi:hypothetical protein
MLLRGMTPRTFSKAFLAGCRPLPRFTHLFVCIADHFEPDWGTASLSLQQERVSRWVNDYRPSVIGVADSRNRPPQHTFFCPIEVYNPHWMEQISKLTQAGFGDVEIHLHHDQDNAEHLKQRLLEATHTLHQRHGLLSKDASGEIRYGFIHGNWALDNSHPTGRWCGVNNEISVLRETGCYADFTMPAAPHAAQTRTINSIYYAIDDPASPKSHDTGIAAAVHSPPPAESLMMVQGPLVVTNPCMGRMSVENGNIAGSQPPSEQRLNHWIRARVIVQRQPNWIFVKLHTHGAQEKNSQVLLGEPMRGFHECLRRTSLRRGFEYFYVTARETAQLIRQAEQGMQAPNFELLCWP